MYRIRNFIFKIKRTFSWMIFIMKMNPWNEYDQLLSVIEKQLNDTILYWEERWNNNRVMSIDSPIHIQDMKLVSKLIRMGLDEHYWNEYADSMINPNFDSRKSDSFSNEYFNKYFLPEYKVTDALNAEAKDMRCIELALKMISYKYKYWWI